nr:zinc ribbon domain-containing protein [Rhodovibrio sodomensis]
MASVRWIAGDNGRAGRAQAAEARGPKTPKCFSWIACRLTSPWSTTSANGAQIAANRADRTGPVRAGQALLSGLLVCGRCGLRMNAHYNNNGGALRYSCDRMASDYGEAVCQSLMGAPVDALVAELVLQALQPAALEASLAVASNLEVERAELDRHWRQRLERARYASERARRQYDAVDPDNRLVAGTLERVWEEALADEAKPDFAVTGHAEPGSCGLSRCSACILGSGAPPAD